MTGQWKIEDDKKNNAALAIFIEHSEECNIAKPHTHKLETDQAKKNDKRI